MFLIFVAAPGIDHFIPRCRIVWTAGADVRRVGLVVNLPNTGDMVAIVSEKLRQCDYIGHKIPEEYFVAQDSSGLGPEPCHHRCTTWSAAWVLAVGSIKTDTLAGQFVNVGRNNVLKTVASQTGIEVINGNEQDVVRTLHRGLSQIEGKKKEAVDGFVHGYKVSELNELKGGFRTV